MSQKSRDQLDQYCCWYMCDCPFKCIQAFVATRHKYVFTVSHLSLTTVGIATEKC